jgi:hypothetical protein
MHEGFSAVVFVVLLAVVAIIFLGRDAHLLADERPDDR